MRTEPRSSLLTAPREVLAGRLVNFVVLRPPVAVLRQAGLPLGLFDQEKILVTTEEMFTLYPGNI